MRSSDSIEALARIGNVYNWKGEPEKAIPSLRTALKLKPTHEHAWLYLSVSLAKLGRYDEAMDAVASGLKVNPQ